MIGLATSDWHLWDSPPAFRDNEPDWWEAMLRPISEIKSLQKEHGCPIFFAGDLFDRWKASPELINWCLKHVPVMYAIPGQHDLPNHRYDDIHKSAYWTMVEAGRLINLKPGEAYPVNDDVMLHAFPWGTKVRPTAINPITGVNVALVHAYCWRSGSCYPGAPEEKRVTAWLDNLGGYKFSVFGDNHRGFIYRAKKSRTAVVNCGTLMRRKADESAYSPCAYLLWSDGHVEAVDLDTSLDTAHVRPKAAKDDAINPDEVIEALCSLKDTRVDFTDAVTRLLDGLSLDKGVRERVMEALSCG